MDKYGSIWVHIKGGKHSEILYSRHSNRSGILRRFDRPQHFKFLLTSYYQTRIAKPEHRPFMYHLKASKPKRKNNVNIIHPGGGHRRPLLRHGVDAVTLPCKVIYIYIVYTSQACIGLPVTGQYNPYWPVQYVNRSI